jgi:hypothetical protein
MPSLQLQALKRSFSLRFGPSDAARRLRHRSSSEGRDGAVKTKENTMQVISTNDLCRLTRAQLFSLLTRFQATLADLAPDSPEYLFATAMLANIKLVLFRKMPSP